MDKLANSILGTQGQGVQVSISSVKVTTCVEPAPA